MKLPLLYFFFGQKTAIDLKHTTYYTTEKIMFCIKDLFSRCDQIRSFPQIWSHLLKKSLIENVIFCAVLSNLKSFKKSKKIFECDVIFLQLTSSENVAFTYFTRLSTLVLSWRYNTKLIFCLYGSIFSLLFACLRFSVSFLYKYLTFIVGIFCFILA